MYDERMNERMNSIRNNEWVNKIINILIDRNWVNWLKAKSNSENAFKKIITFEGLKVLEGLQMSLIIRFQIDFLKKSFFI